VNVILTAHLKPSAIVITEAVFVMTESEVTNATLVLEDTSEMPHLVQSVGNVSRTGIELLDNLEVIILNF